MNNISWFLYAVDVFGTLGGVAKLTLFVSAIISAASFVGYLVSKASFKGSAIDDERYKEYKDKQSRSTRQWVGWFATWKLGLQMAVPIFTISLILATFIPSPKTMYLIMGSEVGEQVVKSETGQRVQDAINKKLDEYLGEDK